MKLVPLLNLSILVATVTMSVTFAGCRTRSEGDLARVKHIAGQLSRPNIIKLTPKTCYYDKIGSSKGRSDVRQYLQKIFDKIAAANSDVFTGDYAPENFCISNSPDDYVNAFASPHGRVMITDRLVLGAANDAAVAFVMAHEASHILMQHGALKLAAGGAEYVDHPWLAANTDWQSFSATHSDRNPDAERQLVDARQKLASESQRRNDFLSPLRKFLNPTTRTLESRARSILDNLNKRAYSINTDVEKITEQLNAFKKTPEYERMDPDQKIAIDEYYGARIKVVLEASPVLIYAVAAANKGLDGIDVTVDQELSKFLSSNLGGYLGSQWRKVNDEYVLAKVDVAKLEGARDFNAKTLMDKASAMIGFNYNRYNWMEAEADQVGLELFLKAGFKPDGSQELFKLLIQSVEDSKSTNITATQDDVTKCLQILSNLKAGSQVDFPERGNLTHPNTCWRLVNTGYTELQIHSSHYAPYLSKALNEEVIPGALAAIKQSSSRN
jgi:hypothetical protein